MAEVKVTSATRWEGSGQKEIMGDQVGSGIGPKGMTFSETE